MKPQAQVLRDVLEEAVLADEIGVDAFGVGEHHRPDFAISAPEVLGLSRFNLKYSSGTLPHDASMTSVELFGTKVAPRVREFVSLV